MATHSALVLGCASGVASSPAWAENWIFTPRIFATETYSTNVNLAPSGQEASSFITAVQPGLHINGSGARVKLNGDLAVQGILYTGQSKDTELFPQANLLGTIEAIEKFFFVEGSATVSQRYLSPFGPQPQGNIGQTENRATSGIYQISPYIRGTTVSDISYSVRNDQIWSTLSDAPEGLNNSYYNRWSGRVDGPVGRLFGLAAEISTNYTKFPDQHSQRDELARGILSFRPDVQLHFFASGGYEQNDYFTANMSGPIYGGGAEWRPTERTDVRGQWEHRFFGSSYLASVSHRNPFTAFTLSASRNVTTFPERLFGSASVGNVAALIDASLTTRIPDATQRAAAVQAFLQQTGLPAELPGALSFYTQQVSLVEQQSATITYLGVRNSTALTLFNSKSEVISTTAGPVGSLLGVFENNRQRGGSISFSHRLTGLTTLGAMFRRFYTTSEAIISRKATGDYFELTSSTHLSAKTDGVIGANYTRFDSDLANDYDAFSAYVGIRHRF